MKFGVFIDILGLKYFNEILEKPINLKAECDYKWVINERDLEKIPEGRYIYSPNFNNNCFTLYFDGKILGLKLLAMPPKWQNVAVDCDFQCNRIPENDIFEWKHIEQHMNVANETMNVMEWEIDNMYSTNTDSSISSIEFKVAMKCRNAANLILTAPIGEDKHVFLDFKKKLQFN